MCNVLGTTPVCESFYRARVSSRLLHIIITLFSTRQARAAGYRRLGSRPEQREKRRCDGTGRTFLRLTQVSYTISISVLASLVSPFQKADETFPFALTGSLLRRNHLWRCISFVRAWKLRVVGGYRPAAGQRLSRPVKAGFNQWPKYHRIDDSGNEPEY